MSYAGLRKIKLRYRSVFYGFVLLFLFICGYASPGIAAPAITIYRDVSDATLRLDSYGSALFYINVSDIPAASDINPNGLAAFQIRINFDPGKIKIEDPNAAWFLTSTGRQAQTSSLATFVDNTNGILSIAYGTTGSQMPPTGSGVIAMFKVTALTDVGTASLIFEEAIAGDNSEPIERYIFTIGDSTINIGTACTPAAETCNGLDDDCDGLVDNNVILDGGDACTVGACVDGVEVYTPISVDDGNACTVDACDAVSGVTHTAKDVNDNNACTIDSCDPATGFQHTAVSADDGNACTLDSCDPVAGVQHAAVNPDDGNACTTDSCDPLTGVQHVGVNADDQNECTVDSCDPVTGVQHVAVNPADENACTTDSCDPVHGVLHMPVNTDDQSACTVDSCNPQTGEISHIAGSVDDQDACTTDSCNPATGVIHTAVNVDDSNACTVDACDAVSGVTHTAKDVNDNNACTTLTINKSGIGSGTVTTNPAGIDCGADCSEPYISGTVVTLIPTPDSGSAFAGWSGDADCTDGSVMMADDKTCTATFTRMGVGLQGEYYDNADLTGNLMIRTDAVIDFNWGNGAPDSAISPDTFSVRWTGKIQADHNETYTFNAITDDGIRLWIDGYLIMDYWQTGGVSVNATLALTAGLHDINMEFFENTGDAFVHLYWSSPSTPYAIVPQDHLYPPNTQANAPLLMWTGEVNYTSDGLDPQAGDTTTRFSYRIKYMDADGDAPMPGYPRVHILKGGQEITGSPFVMSLVNGSYPDGAIYTYSAALDGGIDYTYYFDAKDTTGLQAVATPITATPTAPLNAPDVNTPLIMGDLDGSGRVDGFDLGRMGLAFGSQPGDPTWNPDADLNGDGIVDGEDLTILVPNFGKTK